MQKSAQANLDKLFGMFVIVQLGVSGCSENKFGSATRGVGKGAGSGTPSNVEPAKVEPEKINSFPKNLFLLENSNIDLIGSPGPSRQCPPGTSTGFLGCSLNSLIGAGIGNKANELKARGVNIENQRFVGFDGLFYAAVRFCPAALSRLVNENSRTETSTQRLTQPYSIFSICGTTFESVDTNLFQSINRYDTPPVNSNDTNHLVIITSWGTRITAQQFLTWTDKALKNMRISFVYPKTPECKTQLSYPANYEGNQFSYMQVYNSNFSAFEEIALKSNGTTVDLCTQGWPDLWKNIGI